MIGRTSVLSAVFLAVQAPVMAQPFPPATYGRWDVLRGLNFQAIHMVLTPSGRLYLGGFSTVKVYDPVSDQSTITTGYPSPANYFCSGHVVLPSGLILFAGGGISTEGHQHVHTFDAVTGTWTAMDTLPRGLDYPGGPEVDDKRWYPTLTVLGSGKVLLTAGRDSHTERDRDCSGNILTFVEDVPCIFDPELTTNNQWRRLGENFWNDPVAPGARRPLAYYPFCYSLSDGTLVAAGSYWAKTATLWSDQRDDPEDVVPFPCDDAVDPAFHSATIKLDLTIAGAEDWVDAGATSPIPGGSAVMYRPDKIMKTGGGYHTRGPACGSVIDPCSPVDCGQYANQCPPSQCGSCCACVLLDDGRNEAYTIDMGDDEPQWLPTQGGGVMLKKRREHTLVTLPDGKVLAVCGWAKNATGQVVPVMEAEWYDPQPFAPDTPGPWEALAPMNYPNNQPNADNVDKYRREDHSTAALLPDARLFVAGGQFVSNQSQCDAVGGNFFNGQCFQQTGQIFMPPYLFDAAGNDISENFDVRPVIAALSGGTELYYFGSFNLALGGAYAAQIKRVVLLRLGAVTHQFDQNARYVPVTFNVLNDQTLRVFPPTNPNKAPPGHYMLFVLKQADRPGILFPSKATIVRLNPSGGTQLP